MRLLWIILITVSINILAEGKPLQLSASSKGVSSAVNLTPTGVSPSVLTPQSDQRGFISRGLKPSEPPWNTLIRTLPLSRPREPVDKLPPEKSTPQSRLPSVITAQSDQRGFISQDVKPSELPWSKLKRTLVVSTVQGPEKSTPQGRLPSIITAQSDQRGFINQDVKPSELPWNKLKRRLVVSTVQGPEKSTPQSRLPSVITAQSDQRGFISQDVKPSELPWSKLKRTLVVSTVQGPEKSTPQGRLPSVITAQSDQRGFINQDVKPSELPWSKLKRTLVLSTVQGPEKSTPQSRLPAVITAQSDQRGFISQDVKPSELPWNKLKRTLVVSTVQGPSNEYPTGNPSPLPPSSKGHSPGNILTPSSILPSVISQPSVQKDLKGQRVKPSERPLKRLAPILATSRTKIQPDKGLPGNPSKRPPTSEGLSSTETFTPPSISPMAFNPQSPQRGSIRQEVKPSEPPLNILKPTWDTLMKAKELPDKSPPGMPTMDTKIPPPSKAGAVLKTLRPSTSPSPSTVKANHPRLEASTADNAAVAAHRPTIKVVRRVTISSLKKMMDNMEGLREESFPTSKLAAEKSLGRTAPQSRLKRAILTPTLEQHTGISRNDEEKVKGAKRLLPLLTGESSNKVPKRKGRKETLHPNHVANTGTSSFEKLKAELSKEKAPLRDDESAWESSDEGLRIHGQIGALHPFSDKTTSGDESVRESSDEGPRRHGRKGALHPIPDKTTRKTSNEELKLKGTKETSTTNHDDKAVKSSLKEKPKLLERKGTLSLKHDKNRGKSLNKNSKLNYRKRMPSRNAEKTTGLTLDTESASKKHREEVLAQLAAKLAKTEFSTDWPGLHSRKATMPLTSVPTSEEPFDKEPRVKKSLKPLHLNTQSPTVKPITLAEKLKLAEIKSNQVEEDTAKPTSKDEDLPSISKVSSEHIAPGKGTAAFLPRKRRDTPGDQDGTSNKAGRKGSAESRWSGLSTALLNSHKETGRDRKKRKRKRQWEEEESIGAAAIAAIVSASLVALLVVLVVVAAIYWICRERRKRRYKRADEELGLPAGPPSVTPQWFNYQKDRRPTPYPLPPPSSVYIPMSFNPRTGTVEFINETAPPVNYEIYHSNGILSTSNASAPDRSGRRLSTIVEETRKGCRSREKRRVIKRQTSDRRNSFGENITAARSIILGQSESDLFEKKASERRRVIREAIAAHRAAVGQRRHSLSLLEEIQTARRVITPNKKHKESVERASEKCRAIRSQLSALRRPSFAQEIEVAKSVIVDMERIKHFHENWRLGNAGNVFTILDLSGTGTPVRGLRTSWRSKDYDDDDQIVWALDDSTAV